MLSGKNKPMVDIEELGQGGERQVPADDSAKHIAATPFQQVEIEITVSVGRARPLINELFSLGRNSVLPLDRRIDDPVDVLIGEKLIARGKLVEIGDAGEGQLGICLTEVDDLRRGG